MNNPERYVRCKGKDYYERDVFKTEHRPKIRIIRANGFEKPENCPYLAVDKRIRIEKGKKLPPLEGMCSAVGADKPDKWGFCRYFHTV